MQAQDYQMINSGYDSKVQKLVILFIFEKMAIQLPEAALIDICYTENGWLGYMECKQYIGELIESNLLYRMPKNDYLNITQDGINCLSLFYTKIPMSLRQDITNYINVNRMRYKKEQAYFCDYTKNADGTYTVIMRIVNGMNPIMELKLVVSNKQHAKYIYKNWLDKASQTYALIHDALLD